MYNTERTFVFFARCEKNIMCGYLCQEDRRCFKILFQNRQANDTSFIKNIMDEFSKTFWEQPLGVSSFNHNFFSRCEKKTLRLPLSARCLQTLSNNYMQDFIPKLTKNDMIVIYHLLWMNLVKGFLPRC